MQNMLIRLKNFGMCAAMVLGGIMPTRAFENSGPGTNTNERPKLQLQAAPTNVQITNNSDPKKVALFYCNPRTVSRVIGYNAIGKRPVIHQDIVYDTIESLDERTFIVPGHPNKYLIPGTIIEKYDGHKTNYFYNTDDQFDKYWNILATACNLSKTNGKITLKIVFCEYYTGVTAYADQSIIASMCIRTTDNVPVIYVVGEKIELFRNREDKNHYTVQCNGRSKTLPSNMNHKKYINVKRNNGR